jgi:hypothetical protein
MKDRIIPTLMTVRDLKMFLQSEVAKPERKGSLEIGEKTYYASPGEILIALELLNKLVKPIFRVKYTRNEFSIIDGGCVENLDQVLYEDEVGRLKTDRNVEILSIEELFPEDTENKSTSTTTTQK